MLTWQQRVLQTWLNLLSTETFSINLIIRTSPTNTNMYINTQVNSINPDPSKYRRAFHLHTWKENVLDVVLTTRKRDNYWCSMIKNWKHVLSWVHFYQEKGNKRTDTSEQSQPYINTQILQLVFPKTC